MAELRRAVLKSFDPATHRATLQIEDGQAAYAAEVPVSRGIPAAELTPGRVCALAVHNPDDPADAMVVGVH